TGGAADRASPLGSRSVLPDAGRGVARGDGSVFPRRRLGAASARNARPAAGLSRPPRRRDVGRSDRAAASSGCRRGDGLMFEPAERVADAVLYEGYVLYPYRASAAKNQFRWQFGVLAPRPPGDDGEPWFSQTECLIQPRAKLPRCFVRVRALRPEA